MSGYLCQRGSGPDAAKEGSNGTDEMNYQWYCEVQLAEEWKYERREANRTSLDAGAVPAKPDWEAAKADEEANRGASG
jgi:hypothetical protein